MTPQEKLRAHPILYNLPPEVIANPSVQAVRKHYDSFIKFRMIMVALGTIVTLIILLTAIFNPINRGPIAIICAALLFVFAIYQNFKTKRLRLTDDQIRKLITPD